MSINNIPEESAIEKYLSKLDFPFFFNKPVIKHMVNFIKGSVQKGYKGTIIDIVQLSLAKCHRTTFGKFLSHGAWKDEYAWDAIRNAVITLVEKFSRETQKPIFSIIDDTIAEKTQPSLQAKQPIQAADFHHSHLKNQSVWGHQFLTMMLSANDMILPFFIERYDKSVKSKIERVCEMIEQLPIATQQAYGLCDSWYTCEKVINAYFKKGYHLIGALKTNRVIFPQGVRMQIKDFAQHIERNDVRPVTVNKVTYLVYRYEGPLNGVDNAVVLLCWPEKAFKKANALHAFLCTDVELNTQNILEYYSKRWPIEIFFRESKNNLGLKGYQVRSYQAIDRLLLLIVLTYIYCTTAMDRYQRFNTGLKQVRQSVLRDQYEWIYYAATNGISIESVFCRMKVDQH
jgi:hypothetical protein